MNPEYSWNYINSAREWIGDSGSFTPAAPLLYIAPPPSRHNILQILDVRS